MKQGIGKIVDLHSLLLNSAELPNDESDLETFGREQYSNLFLTNAICGFHLLHDGEQARFARGAENRKSGVSIFTCRTLQRHRRTVANLR